MELHHHGILKQKWGVRNGPPYPLRGGDYTPAQKKAIRNKRKSGNSIYNKKHFDEVLNADKTTLSTLSYDKDRTKNTDMFYATHNSLDKHQYNALFNRPIPQPVYDENGKQIGTKDRDFYNFVTDKDRMQSYFVKDKYKFKGYREAAAVLERMKDPDYTPSAKDLQTVYRMFNYVIPYDGQGDRWKGHDVYVQRTKFFNECKKAGYGAFLDTNDAIYGGFKAKSPIIVFDMEQVIPKDTYRTKLSEQKFSTLVLLGRKALGL